VYDRLFTSDIMEFCIFKSCDLFKLRSCIIHNKYEDERSALESGIKGGTFPTFAKWVQCPIREHQQQGQVVEDPDVYALCYPLATITLRFQCLKTYGNHY
jgi:hypothetical protein